MFETAAAISLPLAASLSGLRALLRRRRPHPPRPRAARWERLLLSGLAFAFLLLFVTGFQAPFLTGARITGWMLLLHCAAGALFALGLALGLLAWADRWRFGGGGGLAKGACWLAALAGTGALLTALVAMLPLAGPAEQDLLYETHRWCGLLCTLAVMVPAGVGPFPGTRERRA